jgi:hypothetical protein
VRADGMEIFCATCVVVRQLLLRSGVPSRRGRTGSAPPLTQALGDAVLAMIAVLRALASCAWDTKPEQRIRRTSSLPGPPSGPPVYLDRASPDFGPDTSERI